MELTDEEIAERIRSRDTFVFESVVDKYTKQLYYLAYNILHMDCTKEDMEECVSDVFLELWVNIDKFDPEKGTLKTWLFIQTKYKALQYKRKREKQKTVHLEDVHLEDAADIERLLILRQSQEKVLEVITGFNDVDKELFIRRYFYNEKINDLAQSLKLTRQAIDNRLLRSRKRIKEVLSFE